MKIILESINIGQTLNISASLYATLYRTTKDGIVQCVSHCKCSVMLPGNNVQKVALCISTSDNDSYTFIATRRVHSMFNAGLWYADKGTVGQHDAWFYRWYFEWLYVSRIHRTLLISDNQSRRSPSLLSALHKPDVGGGGWDGIGGQKEKDSCFLSCHIPPPPTVSYGGRVMNILHCMFWHSP